MSDDGCTPYCTGACSRAREELTAERARGAQIGTDGFPGGNEGDGRGTE